MLLIILALFWVALLTPVVVRRLREGGAERSIDSFHAEHDVLSRQDYTVIPVHRLDEPDQSPVQQRASERRPRLTVVHPEDTFGTLESRSSWDEWSEDYEYEYEFEEPAYESTIAETNHYARAYSAHPRNADVTIEYQEPLRRRSMRAQRRIMFSRLVLAAVVLTFIAFFVGSVVVDLAALAWFSVVVYVALALYAVSQGYLSDSSLRLRRRQLATVKPLYREEPDDYDEDDLEDEVVEEFYEPAAVVYWDREPERRRALG